MHAATMRSDGLIETLKRSSIKGNSTVRHFSIQEANRALPLVKRIVAELVETFAEYRRLEQEFHRARQTASEEVADQAEIEVEAAAARVERLMKELEPIGCQVKDLDIGLIDFPTRHQGRTVLLCWKLGEGKIEFWHETDAGFSGRTPVATLES
jgi:hypothetical protein